MIPENRWFVDPLQIAGDILMAIQTMEFSRQSNPVHLDFHTEIIHVSPQINPFQSLRRSNGGGTLMGRSERKQSCHRLGEVSSNIKSP